MKVVILRGGQGTRLREETEFRPKPMVEIGGRPILWHIMKRYAHHGLRDFVPCLGYRGSMIKECWVRTEALASYFAEFMHLAEGNVVPCQETLQCFLGSLLAVKQGAFHVRRRCRQQNLHSTQVLGGLLQPRPGIACPNFIMRHTGVSPPAGWSRAVRL